MKHRDAWPWGFVCPWVRWRVPRFATVLALRTTGRFPRNWKKLEHMGNEIHPKETNMTGWKINHKWRCILNFLLKMGIFQPFILVFRGRKLLLYHPPVFLGGSQPWWVGSDTIVHHHLGYYFWNFVPKHRGHAKPKASTPLKTNMSPKINGWKMYSLLK